jgi:opacity protein-like surface antigen
MNAFLRKGIGIALLFFYGNSETYAQIDLSKFEIGLTGGTFIYQGDLTPSPIGSYRTWRPAVNLFVNRIVNSSFSLRTSLFYGGLSGDDAAYDNPDWRQQRAFNFHATAWELSELLVWNAWSTDRKFTPYVFGGVGLSFLNIKRDYSHFNGEFFASEDLSSKLAEDLSHNPPTLIPVVPVGIGVQYSLRKNLSLIGETSYRFTRTDYLDGFSQAGNPELYDHYQSHTIGVLYKFGKKNSLNCPTTF